MAAGDPLEPLLQGHPLSNPDGVDLDALAAGIGHAFARRELATEALCHRGALEQRPDLKAAFPYGNERLEFLGDRVLSLAMSQQLLTRFPHEQEGQIARRYSVLVSARVLAEIAEEIGLRQLMIGYSETRPATPAILADAMEALLGAVFLDAGFETAARCVARLWGARVTNNQDEARPPKSELQEWAQARRLSLPVYRQIGRAGSEHEPTFTVEVSVGKHPPAQGTGATKREAESAAAAAFLRQLASS